ncbi:MULTISPECIES: S1C family serine protease [unclassified Streptomyces]|uniref:S1C family serine protease n=1 Tax=unclassified Streptomyces TaxID=2593676 RepID=UPI0006AF0A0E|nr:MULTISPECIES: trypsin-like peptidase domain-containing protein [unclassified Streptomyces]KOX34923.1 protease [Streptomyces sp. NRRL F-6491]KOX50842.1 protease [Streptomyces sp. NRRL F-6492]
MNNGKPNWWSRPSSTPEAARIPSPSPSGDGEGDFPLPAPQPSAAPPAPPETPAPPAAPAGTDVQAPEPAGADLPAPAPAAPGSPEPSPSVVLTKGEPPAQAPVQAQDPAPEPTPAPVPAPPADPAPAPQAQAQAQPLHAPDEYRTPPYGEPGPWAPAPPVQRLPGPVPPQQGPVHPVPPQPQPQGPAPWGQYDPWGVGGPALPPAPAKKSRKGLAVAGALVFALLTGVIGGGIGAYVERNGGLTTVELPQAGAEDTGRAPDSVAGIAASALPGVVTLHVKGSGSSGTGTGFVLNTKGHILTNNHVVDGARSSADISVTFSSGETARAKLVGKDTGYDLAVVQVTGVSGLKPLPLGNSDNVRVGDPVVAIGAPFDLSNTVTSGIISAKERPITAGGEKGDGSDISYVDALQTDAPINPGNSGGPLLDSKARVVGINSAIRAAGGSGGDGEGDGASQPGSIGLGFAIPINQGKRVAEELIRTGRATHPVIGVSLDMQYNGDGARVGEKGKDGTASVTPGGPAAKAGLRPGDVITKVDGQRVHNGEELIVKIRAHRPGDRLELTLDRDGKELTKTLTLGSSQGT